MGKFLFFALGVGVTVFVVVKGREVAQKATPRAVGDQLATRASDLLDQASEFLAAVRTSTAEREAELRAELGMDDQS